MARTAVIALIAPGAVRNRVSNNEHVFSRSERQEPRQHRDLTGTPCPSGCPHHTSAPAHLVDPSLPPCRDHHGAAPRRP